MRGSIVYVATSQALNQRSGDKGLVFKIGKAKCLSNDALTEANRSLNFRKKFIDQKTGKSSYGGPLLGFTDWEFLRTFKNVAAQEEKLHPFLMDDASVSTPPKYLENFFDWKKTGLSADNYCNHTVGYTELHVFNEKSLKSFISSPRYEKCGELAKHVVLLIRDIIDDPSLIQNIIADKRRAVSNPASASSVD